MRRSHWRRSNEDDRESGSFGEPDSSGSEEAGAEGGKSGGTAGGTAESSGGGDSEYTGFPEGTDGCRTENLLYFQDYMEHGRCGGRGQLFVGTLPTTPLCEAAIALGLHGPAYYLDTEGREDLLRRDLHLSLSDPALDGILLFAPDGETLTECEFC